MVYTLRAINTDGTHASPLPDYRQLTVNIEFSDVGGSGFEYAVHGIGNSLLTQQREIAVFDDEVEIPDSRFIIEDSNGNLVSRDGVLYRQWSGRNLWKMFDDACTYPPAWPSTTVLESNFPSAKPGHIMKTLIDRSQAMGFLPGITYNFTSTTDSNGAAWAWQVSIGYEVGIPLLKVLQNLVDQGLVEARMVGRQLQLYNPGTLGTDRTVGGSQVTLWAAGSVQEVPEAGTSRDLRSMVLIIGDEGIVEEYQDATAVATWGKRVLPIKQGGTSDAGTLQTLAQLNLERVKNPRKERTTKFSIVPGGIKPMSTLFPGDWVWSDGGGTLERVRVRQVVIDAPESTAEATCTLRLNDKFMEAEEQINRRVEGITGGATFGGGGTGTPTDPNEGTDTMPPKIPAGLGLATLTYLHQGMTRALLYGSWLQVTQNQDDSPITDLAGYRFAWRYTNEAPNVDWHVISQDNGTSITVSDLLPGRNVEAKVGAIDHNGNFSGYSSVQSIALATDSTPPPVPSTPVVEPYLGQLRIFWNGLGSAGETMPGDLMRVEVHFSTVNNFTPDTTTMAGVMTERGYFIITDLTYDTPYFIKLKAVDNNLNASAPSAQGTATPERITGGDLGAGVVSYDAIAFKQFGNMVPDGSFETTEYRNEIGAQFSGGQWVWMTDAATNFGFAYLRGVSTVAPSTTRRLHLLYANGQSTAPIPHAMQTVPDSTLLVRCQVRSTSGNGTVAIRLRWYDRDGTFLSESGITRTTTFGFWTTVSGYITVPAFAVWAQVVAELGSDVSTGTWDFDAVEIREAMNTLLVVDAAVTNAKIANLAVDDAKIASLSAGKITAGTISADIILSGRFATALSGQRMEINSTGLHAFNSTGVEVVRIQNTGAAWFYGDVRTGATGKIIRLDATATFNNEAGITFERGSGSDEFQPTLFAHYNTFDGASGGGIHLMSAELTGNSSGRARLSLFRGGDWRLGTEWGATGQGDGTLHAGNMYIYAANHYDDAIIASQSYFIWFVSHGTDTVGFTLTYGPTMLSTPINFIHKQDNVLGRYHISSHSTTSVTLAYDAASASWRGLGIRIN